MCVYTSSEIYVCFPYARPVPFPLTLIVCRGQVECNPNIFPDPFKAQVFVRIWDDKMEVSSQAMLTKLTDAIKGHLALFK